MVEEERQVEDEQLDETILDQIQNLDVVFELSPMEYQDLLADDIGSDTSTVKMDVNSPPPTAVRSSVIMSPGGKPTPVTAQLFFSSPAPEATPTIPEKISLAPSSPTNPLLQEKLSPFIGDECVPLGKDEAGFEAMDLDFLDDLEFTDDILCLAGNTEAIFSKIESTDMKEEDDMLLQPQSKIMWCGPQSQDFVIPVSPEFIFFSKDQETGGELIDPLLISPTKPEPGAVIVDPGSNPSPPPLIPIQYTQTPRANSSRGVIVELSSRVRSVGVSKNTRQGAVDLLSKMDLDQDLRIRAVPSCSPGYSILLPDTTRLKETWRGLDAGGTDTRVREIQGTDTMVPETRWMDPRVAEIRGTDPRVAEIRGSEAFKSSVLRSLLVGSEANYTGVSCPPPPMGQVGSGLKRKGEGGPGAGFRLGVLEKRRRFQDPPQFYCK
jgi:hypothetical protein